MTLSPGIVYEDNDLLVIYKPAGLVVNRAETVVGETIQDWVEEKLRIKNQELRTKDRSNFFDRAGIVHRLDKETSGLLIIAKNEESFFELQKEFKEREVGKRYLTLVHGTIKLKKGVIRVPIQRSPFDRKKFGIFLGGRAAVTEYKIREYKEKITKGKKENFTLVEVIPKTGRTHQIRVHFKYLGHPVVGDEIYAGRKTAREDRKWCPRLFLHAYYLKFRQPKTKKEIVLKVDLPEELRSVLKRLSNSSGAHEYKRMEN